MKNSKLIFVVLVGATAAMGLYAGEQHETPVNSPSFTVLGDLAGGVTYSMVNGISGDGTVVVGYSHSKHGQEAFRWTLADGIQGLGFQNAVATSGDGSVVVGQLVSRGRSQGVCWTKSNGAIEFDSKADVRRAVVRGISADGSKFVGVFGNGPSESEGRDLACVWTLPGGVSPLVTEARDRTHSEAFGISADGKVVVGSQWSSDRQQEAFRWMAESGMVGLGFLPGHTTSIAHAVSADGSVVVGWSSNFTTTTAFRWSAETGMKALGGEVDGRADSMAYAVSSDGTTVVGCFQSRLGQEAVIWNAASGMRRVSELLPSELEKKDGPENRGRRLNMATAVSADGKVVAGVGTNSLGRREAWLARLDEAPLDGTHPIEASEATLVTALPVLQTRTGE